MFPKTVFDKKYACFIVSRKHKLTINGNFLGHFLSTLIFARRLKNEGPTVVFTAITSQIDINIYLNIGHL